MKVLHLPSAVGNHSWCLSRGERALGVDSDVLVLDASYLSYPADFNIHLGRLNTPLARWSKLIRTFAEIRSGYNVFHFNWGSTLFTMRALGINHLELPFYPRDSSLFVTYNGCDARQKHPTIALGAEFSACKVCTVKECDSGRMDSTRASGIKKMVERVEHVWGLNPDLLNFLPAEKTDFLPYAVMLDNSEKSFVTRYSGQRPLRVAHAPTNREIKGTRFVLDAVEQINKKYPNSIELLLIEGLSHSDAINLYVQADVVVDQLLIGWYGTFAVEAMMLGKPVIARIDPIESLGIPRLMGEQLVHSVINANPNTIKGVLEGFLINPKMLFEYAENAMDYSRRWHNEKYVASLTVEKYYASA